MIGPWISVKISPLKTDEDKAKETTRRVFVAFASLYDENLYVFSQTRSINVFLIKTRNESMAREITDNFDGTIFENLCKLELRSSLLNPFRSLSEVIILHPENSYFYQNIFLISQDLFESEYRIEQQGQRNLEDEAFPVTIPLIQINDSMVRFNMNGTRPNNALQNQKNGVNYEYQQQTLKQQSQLDLENKNHNSFVRNRPQYQPLANIENTKRDNQNFSSRQNFASIIFEPNRIGKTSESQNQNRQNLNLRIPQTTNNVQKVIVISNLKPFEKALHIFRVFRCYKGLKKVLFMKNNKKAFLEFETTESATLCVQDVNLHEEDLKLRADFSHRYTSLDHKTNTGLNSKLHNAWFNIARNPSLELNNGLYNGRLSVTVEAILTCCCCVEFACFEFELLHRLKRKVSKVCDEIKSTLKSNEFRSFNRLGSKMYFIQFRLENILIAVKFVSLFESKSSKKRKYTARFSFDQN